MTQKGAGGNPGAITTKGGGDGANGATGTGRGGGNNGRGKQSASKKKSSDKGSEPDSVQARAD